MWPRRTLSRVEQTRGGTRTMLSAIAWVRTFSRPKLHKKGLRLRLLELSFIDRKLLFRDEALRSHFLVVVPLFALERMRRTFRASVPKAFPGGTIIFPWCTTHRISVRDRTGPNAWISFRLQTAFSKSRSTYYPATGDIYIQ